MVKFRLSNFSILGLWIEFKEKSVEPIVSYNNEFILQVLTDSEN